MCKRFQRVLSDPNDRHMLSEIYISDSFGNASEHSYQRFLAFLRSHLHRVEAAVLEQVGGGRIPEILHIAFCLRERLREIDVSFCQLARCLKPGKSTCRMESERMRVLCAGQGLGCCGAAPMF